MGLRQNDLLFWGRGPEIPGETAEYGKRQLPALALGAAWSGLCSELASPTETAELVGLTSAGSERKGQAVDWASLLKGVRYWQKFQILMVGQSYLY